MPRLISFGLTTPQFLDRTKTVTRRNGWLHAKRGMVLTGVRKVMGFKRGEKVERFHNIEIVDARQERLSAITQDDVIAEGFPDWTPEAFILFYTTRYNVPSWWTVTRLEFKHLEA